MNKVSLNYWIINKNEISINLMNFFVKINILYNDEVVYYQMYIMGRNREELIFNFYTIEDAICFTEQVINKCTDIKDIIEKYDLMYDNNEFEGPCLKKKVQE